jgi:hypothetical protein
LHSDRTEIKKGEPTGETFAKVEHLPLSRISVANPTPPAEALAKAGRLPKPWRRLAAYRSLGEGWPSAEALMKSNHPVIIISNQILKNACIRKGRQ